MDIQHVFKLANGLAALQWSVMIIWPSSKVTRWLIDRQAVPLLLCIVYLVYISYFFGTPGGFSDLASIRTLFKDDRLLLAGWVHYLAFDLLIGTHILRNGQTQRISIWSVRACLVLTFMFGPVGYLLFSILQINKKNYAIAASKDQKS